jgi:hypothetical protein
LPGGNRNDITQLIPLLQAVPPVRASEAGSGLGTQRWVVARAFAHLHWFRRPRIRWEVRDDIHEVFLALGCALICWRC